MTEGHPDRQKQEPSSRKVALTTLVEEKLSHFLQPGSVTDVEPPPFHKVSPGPVDPLSKLVWYWRKDLAAKFFLVTIAVLLIFSMIFAISASHMLSQLVPRPAPRANIQPGDELKANGTVDPHPTFPVRHGPAGTNDSSLPPKTGTVATLTGTPTGLGNLQIVDIPNQVNANDTVHVTVNGPPNTDVKLTIQYNVQPYYAETSSQTFDDNGKATLDWDVNISQQDNNNTTAQVTAVGSAGQSDTVTIQVN
jgi:hypothetical protein